MSHHFNFIVRKTGPTEWTVYSSKGHAVHVLIRCLNKQEAEQRTKAWASTWNSVNIEVIDEQDKPRDKVPSKA